MAEPQNPDMKEHQPGPKPIAVEETPDSVSYLGVKLPKAARTDSPFVPRREQYRDFIEDRFSLDLQKQLAVSLVQGDAVLVEGGTSIGKTTTVRKMASDLGWEVHYANLNGLTDVEDLMGRYIPNPEKKDPHDPEYIFADGKVTMGLRQEEGKIKVVILDELNSASPNVLIRLHEVLDSLQRGESVVLSEDASETIAVDRARTKIVALTNPPGRGYFGREPLDPAQLRRWVYIKAPSDLPADTFSYSTDALFSLVPQTEEVTSQAFLETRDQALLPEQLTEIPGIGEILGKFKEFHRGAKELVAARKVGADQPQQFTFDDRMEPRRVRDFVLRFYNGDITDTFQNALRYYYGNKLESDTDLAKLEELIRHVEYTPPVTTSQRKGFEREERADYTLTDGETITCLREPFTYGDQGTVLAPETHLVIEGKPYVYVGKDPTTGEAVFISEDKYTSKEERPVEKDSDLARSESIAWKSFLGKDIDVPSPPTELLKVMEQAKREGITTLEPHYLPSMIFAKDDAHPGWSVKPQNWYWENITSGKIDANAPSLGGHWVIVDTTQKPDYDGGKQLYPDDPFKDLFPDDSRFSLSWDDLHRDVLPKIAERLHIPKDKVRLPKEMEFNILGNLHHKEWGQTSTYEWFEDRFGSGGRLVGGDSGGGGLARVGWGRPGGRGGSVGFRPLIVFSS